jgi:hypothetical protein
MSKWLAGFASVAALNPLAGMGTAGAADQVRRPNHHHSRRDSVMVNWLRAGFGLAIMGVGITVFLGVPLPVDARTTHGFAQFAISAGGILAFVGVGVVMSAFPEN